METGSPVPNIVSKSSYGVAQGIANASAFPSAIYQFPPGMHIQKMAEFLPAISSYGFDAVQLPPLHPVFRGPLTYQTPEGNVVQKWGSAYCIVDWTQISPPIFNGLNHKAWFAGGETSHAPEDGWRMLAGFTSTCRDLGLKVIGDLVFGHTSRDPETIHKFRAAIERPALEELSRAGIHIREDQRLYETDPSYPDGLSMNGAHIREGGRLVYDFWCDVAPFNYREMHPAIQRALIRHQNMVVRMLVNSGVDTFRLDSAHQLQPQSHLQAMIDYINAHPTVSSEHPMALITRPPMFYAEILGQGNSRISQAIMHGGINAVNSPLFWWDGRDREYIELHRQAHFFQRGVVAFATNHDTDPVVGQKLLLKLGLAGALSSSYSFMHESDRGIRHRVFLPAVDFSDTRFIEDPEVLKLVGSLNRLKREEPVFYRVSGIDIEMTDRILNEKGELAPSTNLRAVLKTDMNSGQRAYIVYNTGEGSESFTVPSEFRYARAVMANNVVMEGQQEWTTFNLDPDGIVIFYTEPVREHGSASVAITGMN